MNEAYIHGGGREDFYTGMKMQALTQQSLPNAIRNRHFVQFCPKGEEAKAFSSGPAGRALTLAELEKKAPGRSQRCARIQKLSLCRAFDCFVRDDERIKLKRK